MLSAHFDYTPSHLQQTMLGSVSRNLMGKSTSRKLSAAIVKSMATVCRMLQFTEEDEGLCETIQITSNSCLNITIESLHRLKDIQPVQ